MSIGNATRRAFIAGAGAACTAAIAPAHSEPLITGINLSGLEFNSRRLPGRSDRDYTAPTTAELAYYRASGARAVRLPFLWERLQPSLGGNFDADYAHLLFDLVSAARAQNMKVILDPHQYGRRRINGEARVIGEDGGPPADAFAQFWGALAGRCRGQDDVIFALQNEPHDQDQAALVETSNRAIAAIRSRGSRQLILVSGAAWSGAHSWMSSGNAASMLGVRDPANNFAFDVHQYLDQDSSGTHPACVAGASNRLQTFTRWARVNRKRGFLGEFGAGGEALCLAELDGLLAFIAANRDVWLGWTCWAGGPWWGRDYPLSIEPEDLSHAVDRPQMTVLRRHFE
jgi:endoglucanase